MLHTVKKVDYVEGYKLKLRFDDKSIKIVDLEKMLKRAKNMLLTLTEIEYFKKVKCDGTTIHWPNGVDVCPDVLYEMGTNVNRPKSLRKRIVAGPKIRNRSKIKADKLK